MALFIFDPRKRQKRQKTLKCAKYTPCTIITLLGSDDAPVHEKFDCFNKTAQSFDPSLEQKTRRYIRFRVIFGPKNRVGT